MNKLRYYFLLILFSFVAVGVLGYGFLYATSQPHPCVGDWTRCANNFELTHASDDLVTARGLCAIQAAKLAKFGTPEFSQKPFQNYEPEDNSFKTSGIATMIEPNARYQNMYGAMVHHIVTCKFDLRTKQLVDIYTMSK